MVISVCVCECGSSLEVDLHSTSCVESTWSNVCNLFNGMRGYCLFSSHSFCRWCAHIHQIILFYMFIFLCSYSYWITYNNKVAILYLAITWIRRYVSAFVCGSLEGDWRIFNEDRLFFLYKWGDGNDNNQHIFTCVDWTNLRLTVFEQSTNECVCYMYSVFFALSRL